VVTTPLPIRSVCVLLLVLVLVLLVSACSSSSHSDLVYYETAPADGFASRMQLQSDGGVRTVQGPEIHQRVNWNADQKVSVVEQYRLVQSVNEATQEQQNFVQLQYRYQYRTGKPFRVPEFDRVRIQGGMLVRFDRIALDRSCNEKECKISQMMSVPITQQSLVAGSSHGIDIQLESVEQQTLPIHLPENYVNLFLEQAGAMSMASH